MIAEKANIYIIIGSKSYSIGEFPVIPLSFHFRSLRGEYVGL